MNPIPPSDSSIKSFFLGPQAENQQWVEEEVRYILNHWFEWRKSQYPKDGSLITTQEMSSPWFLQARNKMGDALSELVKAYEQEVASYTPRYIGHMMSEISLPAIFGHLTNLLHNPNLVVQDVSKVASNIEKEALSFLYKMIGYTNEATGHFTSGGTVANFEALWRARFRLDHWLSLGVYLRLHEKSSKNLFELAHQGWDDYYQNLKTHKITEKHHRPYSFVAFSPWEVVDLYTQAQGKKFLGPVVLVPKSKHYSWQKGVSLLGFGDSSFWGVELDKRGRLKVPDLKLKIERAKSEGRPIVMVVSVAGTTELGEVDPVHQVQGLLDEYRQKEGLHIWHHVDAAYGGFFCSLLEHGETEKLLSHETLLAFKALRQAESVTIDPHKLGYVPYSCGTILLKNKRCNYVSTFPAPYLQKLSGPRDAWSSTLEGSRAASGAAATWLTGKSIGFDAKGLGKVLDKGILALKRLIVLLEQNPDCRMILPADTNIICFNFAKQGERLSEVNQRNLEVYKKIVESPNFSISKTILDLNDYKLLIKNHVTSWQGEMDADHLVLLRVVLMNPFIISEEANVDFLKSFVEEITGHSG